MVPRSTLDPSGKSHPAEPPAGDADGWAAAERAWIAFQARAPAIKTHAARYLGVQLDRGRLWLRSMAVLAMVWLLVLVTAAVALATAAVQAVTGLAEGLGILFGGHTWLARSVGGGLSVVGVILLLRAGLWVLRRRHLQWLLRKYGPRGAPPPGAQAVARPDAGADDGAGGEGT